MAQVFYPFAEQDDGEDQWRAMARHWTSTGVIPSTTANDELQVYADGTGMFVRVAAGRAKVLGHHYENTTPVQLDLDTVTVAGARRNDLIVLHLDLVPSTNGLPRMRLAVVKGTQGTSPGTPTPTQNQNVYQFPLGVVTVPSYVGTTSTPVIPAANVTWRPIYASLGVLTNNQLQMPGYSGNADPVQGQVAYNRTKRRLEVWNGTGWVNSDGVTGQRWRSESRHLLSTATTDYPSGSFQHIVGITWTDAPAGDFIAMADVSIGVTTTATSAGTLRYMVNNVTTQDMRLDLDSFPRVTSHHWPIVHAGGWLSATVQHASNSVNGRIYNSATRISLLYLGPR